MDATELTRLMSQLGAGLREHIKEPDRWTMKTVDVGIDQPRLGVEVRFARTVGGDIFQMVETVMPEFLADSVITPTGVARYLAEQWTADVTKAISRKHER